MKIVRKFNTLAEASAAHNEARDVVPMRSSRSWKGWRVIVDGTHYRISFNGVVWPDAEWFVGMVPVYDDRRAAVAV